MSEPGFGRIVWILKITRMSELKYKEITEKIIGAGMRVHAALGNGFQEVILSTGIGN